MNIDFKLLKQQKQDLVNIADKARKGTVNLSFPEIQSIEGIINFIDSVEDNNAGNDEELDLLANYQLLPENIQKILSSFDEDVYNSYGECQRIIDLLEQNGYTADYDLSGTLFDLKKIQS